MKHHRMKTNFGFFHNRGILFYIIMSCLYSVCYIFSRRMKRYYTRNIPSSFQLSFSNNCVEGKLNLAFLFIALAKACLTISRIFMLKSERRKRYRWTEVIQQLFNEFIRNVFFVILKYYKRIQVMTNYSLRNTLVGINYLNSLK